MAKTVSDIVVSVEADISSLRAGLNTASGDLGKFDSKAQQVAANFAKVGVAVTAVGGFMVAAAKNAAEYSDEITRLSQVAGVSIERFQSLAYAGEQYSITNEKMSDILKDVNDKMGDFLQTGAGPMADFFENIAPKVGVTVDAFRDLNSAEILQLYVSSLERANVSQAEMTFYMEAIASESRTLSPLLADNGAEMKRLEKNAQDLGIVLDEDLVKNTAEMNRVWASAMSVMKARFVEMASTVLNGFDKIFALTDSAKLEKLETDVVETTRKIAVASEALAKAQEAAANRGANSNPQRRGTSETYFESEIPKLEADLVALNEQIGLIQKAKERRDTAFDDLGGGSSGGNGAGADSSARADQLKALFATETQLERERYAQSLSDFEEYASQQGMDANEAATRREELARQHAENMREIEGVGGEPTGGNGAGGGQTFTGGGSNTKFEAIAEEFATERELEMQRYQQKLDDFANYSADRNLSEEESNAYLEQIHQEHADRMAAIDRGVLDARLGAAQGMFSNLSSLMVSENKKLFNIGKAAAIAQATIQGYEAAVSAWKWGMDTFGLPGAIAASGASLAKTGMLISKISSASASGSSSGSSGGGSSAVATTATAETTTPLQQVNLSLQGDVFSRDTVLSLMEQMQELSADGAIVTVN